MKIQCGRLCLIESLFIVMNKSCKGSIKMDVKQKVFELTQPQKRIWYTQMIYQNSPMFTIGGVVKVHGALDANVLTEAITRLILNADAFHIRFKQIDGIPYQYFSHDKKPMVDTNLGAELPENQWEEWALNSFNQPLSMFDEHLYQFIVLGEGNHSSGYLIKLHHIIADGWSIQILTDAVRNYYEDIISGNSAPNKEWPSYRIYIESDMKYLASERYQKDKNYWIEQFTRLDGMPNTLKGNLKGKRDSFKLSKKQSNDIRKYCKNKSISINVLFITAYMLYQHLTSNDTAVVIGIPVISRVGKLERDIFGMCVSSLPFRYIIDRSENLSDMISRVHRQLLGCYSHQRYPYNHLVKDIGLEQKRLYKVCLNYYNTHLSSQFHGLNTENVEFYNGEQEYELQIIIRDWNDSEELQLDFDYQMQAYTPDRVEDMFKRIQRFIYLLINEDQALVDSVEIMTPEEKTLFFEQYNNTAFSLPHCNTILDLFQQQVLKNPQAIAVSQGNHELSYAQLDTLSNEIALCLKSHGISVGNIVGLYTTISMDSIIGILGILKTGAAYLPIDTNYQAKRISYMLWDAAVEYMLVNQELPIDTGFKGNIYWINQFQCSSWEANMTPVDQITDTSNTAYIIYTSGSTGKPKGVAVSHKNLLNYICWAKEMYKDPNEEVVMPLYSSLAFDLTVTTIFMPLICGGKIIVHHMDGANPIKDIIADNRCTVMKLTPSHLLLLKDLQIANSHLKTLIVGGEDLRTDIALEIHKQFHGNINIFNEYGPTETTVGCMIHCYDPKVDVEGSVPIGIPAGNSRIYVLDKYGKLATPGMVGEIYISGVGVTHGYINNVEQTMKVFLPDPFFSGDVMYKTGDYAWFTDRNLLIYAGRVDEQIKIRGYRIELGEIEAALRECDGIEDVIVNLYSDNGKGSTLYAYYTGEKDISERILREFLFSSLPDYMVPAGFFHLSEFPLTINGKVDKSLLTPKTHIQQTNDKTDECLSGLECLFLDVFKKVMEKETVLLDDNFYHLGGDSIQAIQVSSTLYEKGYKLAVSDILSCPIFRDMLCFLQKEERHAVNDEPIQGIVPLTPIIRWFFEKDLKYPHLYCQSVALYFNEPADIELLGRIMTILVHKHDSLRINVDYDTKQLHYNPQHLSADMRVIEFDCRHKGPQDTRDQLEVMRGQLSKTMDISCKPLICSVLCRTRNGDVWVIMTHHLAIDGISWRILLDDIALLINQHRHGQEMELPPNTASYAEWAYAIGNGTDYIIDLKKPPGDIMPDNPHQIYTFSIDSPWVCNLLGKANETYRTKPVELMLVAFILSMVEHMEISNTQIQVEQHGRDIGPDDLNISRTVGWFTNLISIQTPSRFDIDSLIKETKESYRCQQKTNETTDHNKIQIIFNYLGSIKTDYEHFHVVPDLHAGTESICDIEINILSCAGNMLLLSVSASPSEQWDIQNIIDSFQKHLSEVINHCLSKNELEFTPSDFQAASLTRKELDSLF